MGLLPDRLIEMSFGDATLTTASNLEKGTFVCYSTAGSGAAMQNTPASNYNTVQMAASPSGLKVAGCLLQDVLASTFDETLYHRNYNKEQMVSGDFVDYVRRGYVTTNKITGTPTMGAKAYLTANGVVTPTVSSTGGVAATPLIGEFGSTLDANGYARVHINLPGATS